MIGVCFMPITASRSKPPSRYRTEGCRYKEPGLDPKVGTKARQFLWAETVRVPQPALTCGRPASQHLRRHGPWRDRSTEESFGTAELSRGLGAGQVGRGGGAAVGLTCPHFPCFLSPRCPHAAWPCHCRLCFLHREIWGSCFESTLHGSYQLLP